ncbi:MAG: methyltransferase domain-containing protein [Anaerolineales bacterium]|nr:methyltransferase domain-containing protein [Anaerolineales bacterium]
MVFRILFYAVVIVLLLILVWGVLLKIVVKWYSFPIPQFMSDLIDNPLRRRLQPPQETAIRHGIEPGMTVLDVGPGNGRYTIAAARRVGETGEVVAIDIEPKMIERVRRRAMREGITNIDARVADVYALPFAEHKFDLIYLITVIGEIPSPQRAMQEFHRVLSPSGTLVFSELLPDPHYPRPRTLQGWAEGADFKLREKIGNFFYYTLIFEKNR